MKKSIKYFQLNFQIKGKAAYMTNYLNFIQEIYLMIVCMIIYYERLIFFIYPIPKRSEENHLKLSFHVFRVLGEQIDFQTV